MEMKRRLECEIVYEFFSYFVFIEDKDMNHG